MAAPEISVIVPVYNVEKYLQRCVDSLLRQTFHNCEILLVDDGATDSSGAMCDGYAARDSRVRVIHKPNGGLSDARNAGLEVAQGKYVCFIDSDDYVEPDMLEVLYRLVTEHDADLSICGISDSYEKGSYPQCPEEIEFVCTGREAQGITLEGKKLPGSVCTKLIRRELIGDHRFLKGKTYEDAFFTPELLLRAKTVAATTRSLYYYWHRDDSITTRPFSAKNMDIVEAYAYTLDQVRQRCPEHEELAMFRLCWANFVVLDKMLVTENYRKLPQYPQVLKFLKNHWLTVLRSPHFRKGRRLAALALKLHVGLYRMLAVANAKKLEVHG